MAKNSENRTERAARRSEPSKLVNVKVPVSLERELRRLARARGVTRTRIVLELLDEGIQVAEQMLKGWQAPRVHQPPPKRVCTLEGCGRPYVAKGYCAGHYQAWRRGALPAAPGYQGRPRRR